jgi:hypothetical protein
MTGDQDDTGNWHGERTPPGVPPIKSIVKPDTREREGECTTDGEGLALHELTR